MGCHWPTKPTLSVELLSKCGHVTLTLNVFMNDQAVKNITWNFYVVKVFSKLQGNVFLYAVIKYYNNCIFLIKNKPLKLFVLFITRICNKFFEKPLSP